MSGSRPLKVGFFFPHGEQDMAKRSPSWTDILAIAQAAESAGFDSFWLPDHLLFTPEGEAGQGFWECWSLLAAVAASTSRIQIGPFVTCTGFRNPALLAKIADTVDEISGGRLILGLGAGWVESEYHAYGFPFDRRVSRFEEAIQIIHPLLRHGTVDFAGEFYSARECELRPRGPRTNGPPIMIGTTGDRMLHIAARYADLWNVFFLWTDNDLQRVITLQKQVDDACLAVGRDPRTLQRTACVLVELPGAVGTEFQAPPLRGTPQEIAEILRAYARAGITEVQLRFDPNSIAAVAAFQPILDALDAG